MTEAEQGKYHYVYGPYAEAGAARSIPARVVSAETHDAFEGKIKSETDKPSEILNFPFLNPQNGPIYVNGAEKGDCARRLHQVDRAARAAAGRHHLPDPGVRRPRRHRRHGDAQRAACPRRVKKVDVDAEDGVNWNDKITLPYEPFIGTIGTSPEIEAITSLQPDYYGGNMDLPDVAPGAVIYLPVNAPGALLYLGDCHAVAGRRRTVRRRASSIRPSTTRPGRPDQGLDVQMAASREREVHHDHRLAPGRWRTPPASPIASWSAGWRPTTASTNSTPTCC